MRVMKWNNIYHKLQTNPTSKTVWSSYFQVYTYACIDSAINHVDYCTAFHSYNMNIWHCEYCVSIFAIIARHIKLTAFISSYIYNALLSFCTHFFFMCISSYGCWTCINNKKTFLDRIVTDKIAKCFGLSPVRDKNRNGCVFEFIQIHH